MQALAHAKLMLGRKDQSLANVVAVLEGEYLSGQAGVGESKLTRLDFARNIGDDEEDEAEPPLQKVVIAQLVNYLSESI
jgi:hypothetical protein